MGRGPYNFAGFNEARDACHATAVEKGWWEPQTIRAPEAGLSGIVGGTATVLLHRTFGDLMALIHSEVSEALEEHRNGRKPTDSNCSFELPAEFPFNIGVLDDGRYSVTPKYRGGESTELDRDQFLDLLRIHKVPLKPEGIPSELADVIIRTLDICGFYGIDIEAALAEKAAFNATRPDRHGGKTL